MPSQVIRVPKERFSISKKLKEENKINDAFEIMLANITIEEVIALKMELITKSVGANIYGLSLWRSINFIIKDALIRYALSVTDTKEKASELLSLDKKHFFKRLTIYGLREYYKDPKGKQLNAAYRKPAKEDIP